MKLTIIHHNGTEECHEARESKSGYLDGGITAIGFQFYSKTLNNYILVHPKSVSQIRWDEKQSDEN